MTRPILKVKKKKGGTVKCSYIEAVRIYEEMSLELRDENHNHIECLDLDEILIIRPKVEYGQPTNKEN